MKLKTAYFLFLLLVFFIASNNDLYAFYAKGDTLYVLARKGLNMRAMPNPNAILLQELDYGTKVIISNDSVFDAYQVEDIKDFYIKGNWIKVCDNHNTCGYVFDGYLSKFVAPPIKYELPESTNHESTIIYYFNTFLKLKSQKVILAKHKNCKKKSYDVFCIYKWKEVFEKGVFYEVHIGDGGFSETYKFLSTSLQEIYLLSKIWFLKDNRGTYIYGSPMYIYFDKNKDEIAFSTGVGAGCYYTLKKQGDAIILEGGCGC